MICINIVNNTFQQKKHVWMDRVKRMFDHKLSNQLLLNVTKRNQTERRSDKGSV